MNNIFIEGIQGAGKSSLVQALTKELPELRVYREGDYSPVELAWCTWMSEEEYQQVLEKYKDLKDEIIKSTVKEDNHYIVTYTRILTDVPGFHKDLERYEIYNGRKSAKELQKIVFSRYEKFAETGCLFECSFFQNIMEDLILFHQLSDEEIVGFYRELYSKIDKENFLMLYLQSDKIAQNIEIIRKERSDGTGNEMWYPLMLGYLTTSPYGKTHGYTDFDDMIAHFEHRQQLELRIINELIKDRAIILPAKNYAIKDIVAYIK